MMARLAESYRSNKGKNPVVRHARRWQGAVTRDGHATVHVLGMDTATAKAVVRGAGVGRSRRPFGRDLVDRADDALLLRPAVQAALAEQALRWLRLGK